MNTFQLSILITERCNLRCNYCFCDKTSSAAISIERIMQQVEDCVKEHKNENINILFIGGEPMIAFDEICEIVKLCDALYPNKISYKAVSNGTLIHGKIQEWLIEHQHNFSVTLSIDGDRETHNLHRCNSFDKIDIDFFRYRYKGSREINMVVTPETLPQLAKNVMLWEQQGFYIKTVLADGVTWNMEKDIHILEQQLMLLIAYYLQHESQYPTTLLSSSIYALGKVKADQLCTPGKTSLTIIPDGSTVPCYRGTPYYGDKDGYILHALQTSQHQFATNACQECIVKDICNTCPAQVAHLALNLEEAISYCQMQKVLFRATAYLQAQMLLTGGNYAYLRRLTYEEQADLIENVKVIFKTL